MSGSSSFSQKNKGWAKKILDALANSDGAEVAAGFPAGQGLETPHYTSQRADGTTVAGPSILDVAIWNNYGATVNHPGGTAYRREQSSGGGYAMGNAEYETRFVPNTDPRAHELPRTKPHTIRIPARAFMDAAAQSIAAGWKERMRDYRRQLVRGTAPAVKDMLEEAGQFAQGEIARAIDATTSPGNAAGTIKRKGSSHPLIDTGAMKQAATYLVRERTP